MAAKIVTGANRHDTEIPTLAPHAIASRVQSANASCQESAWTCSTVPL